MGHSPRGTLTQIYDFTSDFQTFWRKRCFLGGGSGGDGRFKKNDYICGLFPPLADELQGGVVHKNKSDEVMITYVRKLWRRFTEKLRFALRSEQSGREVWYMHISPLRLLASLLALLLVLFFVVTLTVAYTPILDMIPDYPGNKSRTMLINSIVRLDSLQRELDMMQLYTENITLIMAGKSPVTHHLPSTDSIRPGEATPAERIEEDSVLRAQMESSEGAYRLNNPAAARKSLRHSLELIPPVKGRVEESFGSPQTSYGISLRTEPQQPIVAVKEGTVVATGWYPDAGYVIQMQHPDNLISTYRNATTLLKKQGDKVRGGEVIGYAGGEGEFNESAPLFGFELWYSGVPVDPESYIAF